jgi:hypothetical protein
MDKEEQNRVKSGRESLKAGKNYSYLTLRWITRK